MVFQWCQAFIVDNSCSLFHTGSQWAKQCVRKYNMELSFNSRLNVDGYCLLKSFSAAVIRQSAGAHATLVSLEVSLSYFLAYCHTSTKTFVSIKQKTWHRFWFSCDKAYKRTACQNKLKRKYLSLFVFICQIFSPSYLQYIRYPNADSVFGISSCFPLILNIFVI